MIEKSNVERKTIPRITISKICIRRKIANEYCSFIKASGMK